ncbi:MAG TPA: hypothetical protein VF221_00520 [Chloroflexota bacterium]
MEHIADSTILQRDILEGLRPRSSAYATAPILDGFTWEECAPNVPAGEWYMVVFRSVRRDLGENLTLEMYDYGAYIEAQRRASGLIFYFRGVPNERRECLSFCIWSSREEAARAARLPLHTLAMRMIDETYESYSLERYILRKRPGQKRLEAEWVPAPRDLPHRH